MSMSRPRGLPTRISPLARQSAWLNQVLRKVTRPENAWLIFGSLLLIVYSAIPILLSVSGYTDPAYPTLAGIVATGVIVMWGTYAFTGGLVIRIPKIQVGGNSFLFVTVSGFAGFALLSWATADQIPLIAAIQGADGETLAYLRESFLKGRGGWQGSFVYVNAILSGSLMPYCIAVMFLTNNRYRWWVFAFFLVYSISFVEKAFFLKAVVPVFYLLCQQRLRSRLKPSTIAVGSVLLLLAFTSISRVGETSGHVGGGDFWTSSYQPGNTMEQLVWRLFSVPLFSAVDAIKLWETIFNYPLHGATSNLVSSVFGFERIEFERFVFAYEWGQNASGTGSANSVYLTEAYVNFGWWGVVAFSAVVGGLLRIFASSRDEAFRALWLLFCLNLYSAGLIGMLFSNGFLLLLFLVIFVRIRGLPMLEPQSDGPRNALARRRAMPRVSER